MIKTVTLTGSEVKVTDLGGQNAAVKNLGSGSIYVSTKPNITAGADNVIEIPAGAGEVVLDAHGTVYIVGTGKVQCTGTSYAVPNFKLPSSSSGGGGGTSDVTKEYVDAQDATNLNLAKAYTDNAKSEIQTTIDTVDDTLNTHIADQVKHITAAERTAWNAKAETDTATSTANGLMSAADKKKLDGIATGANKYSLPLATASVRGGAKIGYEENGKNYPVELASEKMFVNVPWENTTYSEATTSAAGLMSAADKSSLNTHIADQVKHITAAERRAWNAKADLSDIPDKLPADGGNADTVDGKHAVDFLPNKAGCVYGANYDDFTVSGFYEVLGNDNDPTQNSPTGDETNNNFYLIVQTRSNEYCSQIAVSVRTDKSVYIRNKSINIWDSWTKIMAGNADTVNGHTVNANVPAGAVFTDTTYKTVSQTKDGLMSADDKKKLDGIYSGATPVTIRTGIVPKDGTTNDTVSLAYISGRKNALVMIYLHKIISDLNNSAFDSILLTKISNSMTASSSNINIGSNTGCEVAISTKGVITLKPYPGATASQRYIVIYYN